VLCSAISDDRWSIGSGHGSGATSKEVKRTARLSPGQQITLLTWPINLLRRFIYFIYQYFMVFGYF